MIELQDMSDEELQKHFDKHLLECTEVVKALERRYPVDEDDWTTVDDSPAEELACAAARTLLKASQRNSLGGCILCRS